MTGGKKFSIIQQLHKSWPLSIIWIFFQKLIKNSIQHEKSTPWIRNTNFRFLVDLKGKNHEKSNGKNCNSIGANSQKYSSLKLQETKNFFVIKNYFEFFLSSCFAPVGLIFHIASQIMAIPTTQFQQSITQLKKFSRELFFKTL